MCGLHVVHMHRSPKQHCRHFRERLNCDGQRLVQEKAVATLDLMSRAQVIPRP